MNAPIEGISVDFSRIDSPAGPPLIAYVTRSKQGLGETDWHRHFRGQFMYVESGMACVRVRSGAYTQVWAIVPHRVGWMPPGIEHTVSIIEPLTGWGVWVAPEATSGLPEQPAMLRGNDLMRSLVHRAAGWGDADTLTTEQQRLMDVLMDEMRHAQEPDDPITLPMPNDHRLLRVAQSLLAHPGDTRNRDEWASWVGLSVRSLSRLFREETGLSFVQWRQQMRLNHALEQLGQGRAVTHVADALGYASVSAFVAMFRRSMGQSPGRYLSMDSALESA